jgi:hypothetical protein
MKQMTVKATDFLDWYFSDAEDIKHIGERMTFLLKTNGSAYIDVEQLFYEQDDIPGWICNNVDEEFKDVYIGADEIEFINDYNK